MNATHDERPRDEVGLAEEAERHLAAETLGADDAALIASIRTEWEERDALPDGLIERIQFALTLDALHAEVATLTRLDLATSGARGGDTEAVRTVTFTSQTLVTMVSLTQQPDGSVRIDGWTVPEQGSSDGLRVEVLLAQDTRATQADGDGRFVFESVPTGMAKFVLHHDGRTVLSPALEI